MQKYAAPVKVQASGFLVYHPPGHGIANMGPSMVEEFLKQLVIAVIAAWLVSISAVAGFGRRVMFVSAIGVTMALTTNASYLFWYGFPLSYTLANMTIEFRRDGVCAAWRLPGGLGGAKA